MGTKKNSQLKKNKPTKREEQTLRRAVHTADKRGITKLFKLPASFATHQEEQVAVEGMALFDDGADFPDIGTHSDGEAILDPKFTPEMTYTLNILRAANVLATLETITKALDVMTKNLGHICGDNTTPHKNQQTRSNTIKNIVAEMKTELTPTLKTYVKAQVKLLNPKAKRNTTYAKITEKIVTV